MSIKNIAFEVALHSFGPANTYAFLVWIGNAVNSSFLIETATYPSITRADVAVPILGRTITVPTVLENSGDFRFTVVETKTFISKWELAKMLFKTEQKYNAGYPGSSEVWGRDFFDITLVPLQQDIPATFLRMKGCYLKERGPVTLQSSSVTVPWKWDVTIHYTALVEKIPIIELPVVADAKILAAIGALKGLNKLI